MAGHGAQQQVVRAERDRPLRAAHRRGPAPAAASAASRQQRARRASASVGRARAARRRGQRALRRQLEDAAADHAGELAALAHVGVPAGRRRVGRGCGRWRVGGIGCSGSGLARRWRGRAPASGRRPGRAARSRCRSSAAHCGAQLARAARFQVLLMKSQASAGARHLRRGATPDAACRAASVDACCVPARSAATAAATAAGGSATGRATMASCSGLQRRVQRMGGRSPTITTPSRL